MEFEVVPTCQIPRHVLGNLYHGILCGRRQGTFVEVGAYDGIEYSNTYGLLKAGWRGIYVEPEPELARRLRINLSGLRWQLHDVAASSTTGRSIALYRNGALSSVVFNNDGAKLHQVQQSNTIPVPTAKLDDILADVCRYDLLVIDVEGHEIEVLKGYSQLLRHRPAAAIIETHDQHPAYHDGIKEYADQYFIRRGYVKWFWDMINTIYVHQSVAGR